MKMPRKPGVLNVREKGEDGRWWSPNRDITHVFPAAMQAVFYALDGDLTPAELEVIDRLGISDEEIKLAVRLYSKLISCVELRQNIVAQVESMGLRSHKVTALLGMIFLRLLTELFASKYGATLHKGEADPNQEILRAFRETLEQFYRPRSFWSKAWSRLRCMLVILRYPL